MFSKRREHCFIFFISKEARYLAIYIISVGVGETGALFLSFQHKTTRIGRNAQGVWIFAIFATTTVVHKMSAFRHPYIKLVRMEAVWLKIFANNDDTKSYIPIVLSFHFHVALPLSTFFADKSVLLSVC